MRDALPPGPGGQPRTGFTCQACGHVIITAVEGLFTNPAHGSHQRFCSPACRQAAYRRRHADVAEDAPRQHTGGRSRNLKQSQPTTQGVNIHPSIGGQISAAVDTAFAGFRFPREVISVAVRLYLRYGLSYRDVEELLTERGVTVDHVTIYRWVQRFTPAFVEAARTWRQIPGDRWFVDETYVKVNRRWTYLYRAVDQYGQVIDVWLSTKRDLSAARAFFTRALATGVVPVEVTTDRAPAYPRVLDELIPGVLHDTDQYANNRVEADHGRLKARLRPMRGLKTFRSARILATGHALVQNLRRGHYEIATDAPVHHRVRVGFDELTLAV